MTTFKKRADVNTPDTLRSTGKMKRRPLVFVGLGVLLIVFSIAFIPFIEVEKLTNDYGSQFEDLYLELGYFKECDYLKVLKYKGDGPYVYCSNSRISEKLASASDDQAVVLYVVDGHSAAVVVVFDESSGGTWGMNSWGAVWSSSGSADDFTWPVYR